MNYLSVCSGVEAATVAWHSLGWQPLAFSEIEPFPSAVLAHHYPNVPNFGDMNLFNDWNINGTVDLLVGGTPCQSFSVAGLRKGLEDPRGNLALVYLGIAHKFRPKWIVWENVPGVLSSGGGKDFGSFLGALAELGYGFSYRVLDAQFFGVAQRRRRVFVVGYLGDWRPTAAVLFERQSLRRDTEPSREKREGVAPSAKGCAPDGGETVGTLMARDYKGIGNQDLKDGRGLILEPIAIQGNLIGRGENAGPQGIGVSEDGAMYTLTKTDVHGVAHRVFFEPRSPDGVPRIYPMEGASPTLNTMSGGQRQPCVTHQTAVRRLTPIECERLQGFPDNYTNIPWRKSSESPDGPRYKAMGNSMAVPVMRWIGQQIAEVEAML